MESLGLDMQFNKKFFKGKRILITGHTGFKGTWLSNILVDLGAVVCGYSLETEENSLFNLSGVKNGMQSIIGDIRDLNQLKETFNCFKPEIVMHLAAQPIVRDSYKNPVYTYETNVMGTVNVCECVRLCGTVKSFLNVTTDKVYKNNEWNWGYREIDPLDGFDPYSNSKSCSELVTHSYINSFFSDLGIAVSTARAGNVIGGGDLANDRIIPDCYRSACDNKKIEVRNPNSIRPYQHVLEPLFSYLNIVEKQYNDIDFAGFYNIGPEDVDCINTAKLVSLFCEYWGDVEWVSTQRIGEPHEASFLKLDCSKFKTVFQWKPYWNIEKTVQKTVEFYKEMSKGEIILHEQIQEFLADIE